MPRLAPMPLQLTEPERSQLQQLVRRHSTPQQIALRASILLLADEGLNHRAIGRELHISRDMARLWRNRWLALSQKGIPVLERGKRERREFEDIRHGTQTLIASFDVAQGRVVEATVGERRTEADYLKHVEQLIATDPKLAEPSHKIVFHFTPKHCSSAQSD